MRHDDKQKELNVIKEFWTNKIGFQHRGLINNVLAKRFINPGGPPVFKLHFFWGGRGGWLISRGLLILTWHYIYMYIYITYIAYSILDMCSIRLLGDMSIPQLSHDSSKSFQVPSACGGRRHPKADHLHRYPWGSVGWQAAHQPRLFGDPLKCFGRKNEGFKADLQFRNGC